MTVGYIEIVGLAVVILTYSFVPSAPVAVVAGVTGAVVYAYLPLTRTNGTFGADTDRYWGFTK